MADKVYHLLSSAARRQYAEDILRVLALPVGANLQFRYATEIVAPEIKTEIDEGKLSDKPCIISSMVVEGRASARSSSRS